MSIYNNTGHLVMSSHISLLFKILSEPGINFPSDFHLTMNKHRADGGSSSRQWRQNLSDNSEPGRDSAQTSALHFISREHWTLNLAELMHHLHIRKADNCSSDSHTFQFWPRETGSSNTGLGFLGGPLWQKIFWEAICFSTLLQWFWLRYVCQHSKWWSRLYLDF